MTNSNDICPYCGEELNPVEKTKSGKKLRRCSAGKWNPQTQQTEGCLFVKWIDDTQKTLDEMCPKCGSPLVLQVTKNKKKLKKCSTSKWDRENMVVTGCDYVKWIDDKEKELDEHCPQCGANLVLKQTNKGIKMKKCSTAGWDSQFRQPTGCTYIEWVK